jgi:hypothetical protein
MKTATRLFCPSSPSWTLAAGDAHTCPLRYRRAARGVGDSAGLCEYPGVAADPIWIRPAEDGGRRSLALLFAAVAEERDGIAAEPPIDVVMLAANWELEGTLVALADGMVVGELRVEPTPFGHGEIGIS